MNRRLVSRAKDDPPRRFQAALDALEPGWRRFKFLAACSGGLDSTALLRLLALSLPPGQAAAAHLNHGLRGPAAEADQDFVARTAGALGFDFITEKSDAAALARRRKKGLEEAARLLRYDFLARSARAKGADFILTAHQADDQAETMLMNLLRGAGPGGLAGIPPRRRLEGAAGSAGAEDAGVEVLRPLLAFSRAELQAWLESLGQDWREDESNRDGRFRRNAVRQEILPRLKLLNPRLLEALGRSAALLRAEEDFWKTRLAELRPRIILAAGPAAVELDRRELAALAPAERRRLVLEILRGLQRSLNLINEPATFASVETALQIAGGGLDLPGGLRAAAKKGVLRLSAASRLAKRPAP